MKIFYKQSREDICDLNEYLFYYSKNLKKSRRQQKIILFITYILFVSFYLLDISDLSLYFKNPQHAKTKIIILISIVFIPLIIFYDKYSLWKSRNNILKAPKSKYQEMTGEINLKIKKEEVTIIDALKNETQIKYKDFTKIVQYKHYFFLFTPSKTTLIIPQDVLNKNKSQFYDFIQSKLTNA